jgi:hypothetical protein
LCWFAWFAISLASIPRVGILYSININKIAKVAERKEPLASFLFKFFGGEF